jgi:soluble lytic murein transglycosylase
VSREHPLALHRLVPVGIVAVLALVAFLALRGPQWFQRLYHPLAYEAAIAETARAVSLDPYLVAALINVESGFKPGEVSPRGAVGLMQVMPSTAAEVARGAGLKERVNAETLTRPGTNLRVGTRYLAGLMEQYDSVEMALAAYNAGSANVDVWVRDAKRSGRPFREAIGFPETARYVEDVLSGQGTYSVLYPDAFRTGTAE